MVAIATGQKDILEIMLKYNSKILDVDEQNNAPSIVYWAMENDYITLLNVCMLS